jgi:acetyl esterase/lipase
MPRLDLAISPSRLRWRRGLFLRGLERLPVVNAPEPPRARNARAECEDESRLSDHDLLQNEGAAYARRLKEAGNEVELAHYPTLTHGLLGMAGTVDEARRGV